MILKPRDNGIVLWTLRFGDEVRDPGEYFASIRDVKPDPELMRLIGDLIKSRKKAWSPEMVADPVQAKLLDIIEAKKKGAKKAKAKPSAEPEPPKQRHQHHGRAAPKRRRRQEDEGALVSSAPDHRLRPGFLGFRASIGAAAARKSAHGSAASEARRVGVLRMVK